MFNYFGASNKYKNNIKSLNQLIAYFPRFRFYILEIVLHVGCNFSGFIGAIKATFRATTSFRTLTLNLIKVRVYKTKGQFIRRPIIRINLQINSSIKLWSFLNSRTCLGKIILAGVAWEISLGTWRQTRIMQFPRNVSITF